MRRHKKELTNEEKWRRVNRTMLFFPVSSVVFSLIALALALYSYFCR